MPVNRSAEPPFWGPRFFSCKSVNLRDARLASDFGA